VKRDEADGGEYGTRKVFGAGGGHGDAHERGRGGRGSHGEHSDHVPKHRAVHFLFTGETNLIVNYYLEGMVAQENQANKTTVYPMGGVKYTITDGNL